MGQPVVHFEIIGGNPAELRAYYAELFGWTFHENSPVAAEVSCTDSYSFIDRMTTATAPAFPAASVGGAPSAVTPSSTSGFLTWRPR